MNLSSLNYVYSVIFRPINQIFEVENKFNKGFENIVKKTTLPSVCKNTLIMYAIVNILGQQFKVEEKQQLFVHRLEGAEGEEVKFNDVLLVDNGGSIKVGKPSLSNASVSAKIISHVKGDKVLVFKKREEKDTRR